MVKIAVSPIDPSSLISEVCVQSTVELSGSTNIICSCLLNPYVTTSIQKNLLIGVQVIKKNALNAKIERRKVEVANRRRIVEREYNLFFFRRSTCHLIHSKELAHWNAGHKDECVAPQNRKKKTKSSKQKNGNIIEAVD